jgi:hypothetical protein
MSGAKHTASTMTDLLRQHYNPDGRAPGNLFMPEIGAPNGRRRADLLVAPTSIAGSKASTLIGHEIKVSRSDVMAELADPTKADPWLRYCNRWYLVVSDPSLVEGLEVPELWGIMAPPSGRRTRSMTILREAPKLHPDGDLSPALSRISAYMLNRMEERVRRAEYDAEAYKDRAERAEVREQEARLAGGGGHVSPHAKRINIILNAVTQQQYVKGMPWIDRDAITDESIIDAILDFARTKSIATEMRRNIERTISDLRRASEPMAHVIEELKTVAAEAAKNEVKPAA